jgi:hypothetical protein
MQTSQSQLWANAATLSELQKLAKEHSIDLPPKIQKIGIVKLLLKNNVSRPLKRKAPVSASVCDISGCKKPNNSCSKNKNIEQLVHKIKQGLNEPLVLKTTTTVDGGLQLLDDNLVIKNNKVVGKFLNGNIVFLNEDDVEKAIGNRIDFDKLRFVPSKKPIDEEIVIDDYLSDEDGEDGEED